MAVEDLSKTGISFENLILLYSAYNQSLGEDDSLTKKLIKKIERNLN